MLMICIFLSGLLCHFANIVNADHAGCPVGYEQHPLILMSIDGFRPDYLDRGVTPTLQNMALEGVYAPYMTASYPTVTFPNHYTIVTGLYPESHGIIANSFFDSNFSESFDDEALTEGKWFGGEPIWNTVIINDMNSGAYFWPGSEAEIGGIRPTYFFAYNGSVPYEDRIDQVLTWLAMPVDLRPSWICVYFDEPDHMAHEEGPNSINVTEVLQYMDDIVLSLVEGIADLNLTDCVNLIIISDHGMSDAGMEKVIHLEEYEPNLDEKAFIYFGANSRLDMRDGFEDEQISVMESLACETDNMRQFDTKSLPKRYHFSNNPARIEDIILDLEPGHAINFESNFSLEGQHGYDNEYIEMQSIFIASGPDFKKRIVTRSFQNIELYNLMCDLMSLEPASNNGTKGALYHILENPPIYPNLSLGVVPEIVDFPLMEEIFDLLDTSECSGDLTSAEDWIFTLDVGEAEQAILDAIHIPFGVPLYTSSISSNVTLLYHGDHITGFSQTLKLPIWTSFTFNNTPIGSQQTLWSSDVRLSDVDSPKCSDYDAATNISMQPLFRPEASQDQELDRIPFLISNSLPMTTELETRYSELMTELVPIWQQLHGGPLNIITGPVFDSDFNSLVDDLPDIIQSPLIIPSDIFVIVTKCSSIDIVNLNECAINDLQVTAFIYTQTQTVSNCLLRDRFAEAFSARVKDIELSTGLIFFSDLGYQGATDLALRCTLELWDAESQSKSMASAIYISPVYLLSLIFMSLFRYELFY